MGDVNAEISEAKKILGLKDLDISLLDKKTNEKLYYDLLDYFLKSGDRQWWWEDFSKECFNFKSNKYHFKQLTSIIPDLDKEVWFMVEDDYEDYYPIYKCNPRIIGDILGECFAFEYYVISKDMNWLICENHHNRLFGIGDLVREKNIDRIE